MKYAFTIVLLLMIYILQGCYGFNPYDPGIDRPPVPTTKSICPLAVGNSWDYSYTRYDTSGNTLPPDGLKLDRSIPAVFLLQFDSVLTPTSAYTEVHDASMLVYKLEWEDLDSGLLVRHIGTGELSKRGLYIAGKYTHETTMLYDTPLLWLAYPASAGSSWNILIPGQDSSDMVKMELVATDAHFYTPLQNNSNPSPLYFLDSCYLYKETSGTDTTFYYYYHPLLGCLGYLQYNNEKLVVTCILTGFSNGHSYYW